MLIFDEYKYALRLLNHGFVKFMSNIDLTILAKYLRHIGKTEDQILEDLYYFCEVHNPEFNEIIFGENIKNAIKKSIKRPLLIPKPIPVTQKEIDTIKSINNYNAEKVLFILLIVAKHYRINLGWHDYIANIKRTEIFTRAKVHALKRDKDILLTILDRDFGLTDAVVLRNIKNMSLRLTFVDEESVPIFYVNDFDNIIDFLPQYCSNCGKQIQRKYNNKKDKFCNECWKKHRKEWDRKRKSTKIPLD
jgi:hypothetical protein